MPHKGLDSAHPIDASHEFVKKNTNPNKSIIAYVLEMLNLFKWVFG
jgi:hypothetical protein